MLLVPICASGMLSSKDAGRMTCSPFQAHLLPLLARASPCWPSHADWSCSGSPSCLLHHPRVCILHVLVSPAHLTPQSAACRRTTLRLQ